MSRRKKPDIIFTEPVQHHETPREKLYNSRKRNNLKRSFGMAAMLIGIGALLMFVFPLITFPIGFLGVILGVVAIGADSAALETMAFEDGTAFPVHQSLLVDHGIYVLESMNTAELAADGAHEFFFVLGQPRFAGSVQAVISPVAIR